MGDAAGANLCHPAFGTSAREKAIAIETPRTIIRPYEGSEAPLLLPIFSNPTTMFFWSRPLDKDAVAAWVARAAQEFRQTGMGRMLVGDRQTGEPGGSGVGVGAAQGAARTGMARMRGLARQTGEPVGDCGIMRAEVGGRIENDLGYIIHHPYWGAGPGVECARGARAGGLR